jgi:hypothetical protein
LCYRVLPTRALRSSANGVYQAVAFMGSLWCTWPGCHGINPRLPLAACSSSSKLHVQYPKSRHRNQRWWTGDGAHLTTPARPRHTQPPPVAHPLGPGALDLRRPLTCPALARRTFAGDSPARPRWSRRSTPSSLRRISTASAGSGTSRSARFLHI